MMCWKSRVALIFMSLMAVHATYSQEVRKTEMSVGHELCTVIASKFKVPQLTPPPPKPSNWKRGALLDMGLTQTSFTNWAAGGNPSLAMNGAVNMYANYAVKTLFWESRLQVAYGFIQQFGAQNKKSDDKFILDSKFGYKAWGDKFYFSTLFNFKSQLVNGYNYTSDTTRVLVSGPFSPAYASLGVGIDYRPLKKLAINFSPLTGSMTVVNKRTLRTRYGNLVDQKIKLKLGAQFKLDYSAKLFKRIDLITSATFFSDFLDDPQNLMVNWDMTLTSKLNKFFSTNIKTNLIYDDDILIEDSKGVAAPRIQFKEIFTFGFSYTFGEFKK